VLIGEGADEIFLGYPQYTVLDRGFRHLPRALVQRLYLAMACLMPPRRHIVDMVDPRILHPR